jgi:predicted RNase H-like nuclease
MERTRTNHAPAAGIDGCRAGWFYVELDATGGSRHGVASSFAGTIGELRRANLVLVDIPIGLPGAGLQARECDMAARQAISPRGSTIFPAPSRAALDAKDYAAACAANQDETGRRISRQCWNIVPKIREADRYLRRATGHPPIREMHPEVAFWALNGGKPLMTRKKSRVGLEERLAVLERYLPDARAVFADCEAAYRRKDVARDDIVDAMAGAVTGTLRPALATFPARPARDGAGLPMEIVYARP